MISLQTGFAVEMTALPPPPRNAMRLRMISEYRLVTRRFVWLPVSVLPSTTYRSG